MTRIVIVLATVVLIAGTAAAYDLGSRAPDKPASAGHPTPPPDPEVIRQGGNTMLDALLLPIPGTASGTTVGYTDDYDEACPYTTSTAPDVVYRLAPARDILVDIDMLGSLYDTKIYLYREDFTLVACNDDFYPDYVSFLEAVPLEGDTKYFLVIDGYETEAGEYVVEVREFEQCELSWPGYAEIEGEPPLVDGYVDVFNSGCNSPGEPPFGHITMDVFRGRSGWYLDSLGNGLRDTDWYRISIPSTGYLEIRGDAEFETYMFELGPQDCNNVAVIQNVTIGPCSEGTMTIQGPAGSTVWFWVGPATFEGPVNEYDYLLFTNLWAPPPIATETHSWTAVKGLFND